MERDTYGSKLRDLLTPYYDVITMIISNKNGGDVTDEMLIETLRKYVDVLSDNFKEILGMSYDDILYETEYIEKYEE